MMKRVERSAIWHLDGDRQVNAREHESGRTYTGVRPRGINPFAEPYTADDKWDWDSAIRAVEQKFGCRLTLLDAVERTERWTDKVIEHAAFKVTSISTGTTRYSYAVASTSRKPFIKMEGEAKSWEHAIEIGRKLVPVVRAAIETATKAEST